MINDKLRAAFASQKNACDALGSPLTAALVQFFHDDFVADGMIARLTRGWQGDPLNDNVPLRLAGFVHYTALAGRTDIARFFASCGGAFSPARDMPALRASLTTMFAETEDAARKFLRRVPQTNETGRAALLLLGFSEIARRTGQPLRLCEMGASAGLNLFFDQFHYRLSTAKGPRQWGPADSPLTLSSAWRGLAPPDLLAHVPVADRRGCDLAPVDLTDATEQLVLQSWIWGDMAERRARLLAAIDIALAAPPQLDRADAAGWVASQIMQRPTGQTTVLYHSIVWPYLDVAQRMAIESSFAQAGESVTPDTPLAWLKLDSVELGSIAGLSYRLWTGDNGPDGEEVVIGPAHPHGADVQIDYRFA